MPEMLEPRTNKVGSLKDRVRGLENRNPQESKLVPAEEDIVLKNLRACILK